MSDFNYGTGKRKNAVARTRLYQGTGQITINDRPCEEYFPRKTLQMIVQQALKLTKNADKFDIKVNVAGGGVADGLQLRRLFSFDQRERHRGWVRLHRRREPFRAGRVALRRRIQRHP